MAADNSQHTSKLKIYRLLRREIINGRRFPGERLTIDDLARTFGTSVTPVRDALQMLGQEGLVTIRPRAGYFVSQITLKQLHDMLELREILEVAAVERAAARIDADEIAVLRAVHGGYTGDDDDSYARYTEENRRFHCLLAEASGNHELTAVLGRLHDRLARFMVIRHGGENQPRIHGRLVERLVENDVTGARQAIRKELEDTRQAILERVMQEEAANWHLGATEAAQ